MGERVLGGGGVIRLCSVKRALRNCKIQFHNTDKIASTVPKRFDEDPDPNFHADADPDPNSFS